MEPDAARQEHGLVAGRVPNDEWAGEDPLPGGSHSSFREGPSDRGAYNFGGAAQRFRSAGPGRVPGRDRRTGAAGRAKGVTGGRRNEISEAGSARFLTPYGKEYEALVAGADGFAETV